MKHLYLSPASLIILAFIFIGLVIVLYLIFSASSKKPSSKKYNKYGDKKSIGVCPICGTILDKDERLITAVYPGNPGDRLCYIYGCPHCYPLVEEGTDRRCPVCKDEIGGEDYLIARYFTRNDASERIHILGCTKCRFQKHD